MSVRDTSIRRAGARRSVSVVSSKANWGCFHLITNVQLPVLHLSNLDTVNNQTTEETRRDLKNNLQCEENLDQLQENIYVLYKGLGLKYIKMLLGQNVIVTECI